jgi:hypothetical protein
MTMDMVAGLIGLRFELEEFLYHEANLLDRWQLEEWLALFSDRGRWLVPSTDLPDGDPARDLFLVHDDLFGGSSRRRPTSSTPIPAPGGWSPTCCRSRRRTGSSASPPTSPCTG